MDFECDWQGQQVAVSLILIEDANVQCCGLFPGSARRLESRAASSGSVWTRRNARHVTAVCVSVWPASSRSRGSASLGRTKDNHASKYNVLKGCLSVCVWLYWRSVFGY